MGIAINQGWLAAIALVLAAILDFVIGDPWGWPHPVQAMGWVIQRYSLGVLGWIKHPQGQRLAGVWLGLGLVIGSGLLAWWVIALAGRVHWGLAIAINLILLASCFAGRSLRRAAADVLTPLQAGDLATARERLGLYVGRDTADLSEAEVLRAVLETISENATDGVLAPLFYASLGAWLGLGSLPLALAYKAASTLDSMVGYREAPYTYLGWFSARLEDGLTWVPCRLTVLTIALICGHPRRVWRICRRDAIADPSPNAGWSEAAYAAALGVQVGGTNRYRGVVKVKPKLGDSDRCITPEVIRQGLGLTRTSFLLWLAIATGGLVWRAIS